MTNKSDNTIGEKAKKIYNELYPQFNFLWNKVLIAIWLISIILIALNNGDIITLWKWNFLIILILILSAWKLLYRIWEYIGFIEWYEMWHKKWFDDGREKWIK